MITFEQLLKRSNVNMQARWNNQILADSDDAIIVEGNHYFPPQSVNKSFLRPSDMHSICHWKGEASYYDIEVDGQTNANAAWYYPAPAHPARQIKDYVAFWQGVEIVS